MSFGQRTKTPTGDPTLKARTRSPRTRRGGYWFGLLTCLGVSAVTLALLPFISQFKLNGAALSTLVIFGGIALLNMIAVAAVIMLLVDFALRGLGWRRPWIYAVTCALTVLIFYLGLALVGGSTNPIFALYVAVWPAAVGGWVMGLYRR